MKKVRFVLAVSASVALFGACLSSPASKPASGALDKYWESTGKTYPAGGKFAKPMAFAPGQYVVTGSTANGKRQSVTKTLLVRKEQGGWVFETVGMDAKGKETVGQILIAGMDEAMQTGDGGKISLVWMKTRDEKGVVQTIEGDQMKMYNAVSKSTWTNMVVDAKAAVPGGPISVPAGSFADTVLSRATTKVLGFTVETESWMNAAVPINGMVKSRSTDGKSVVELLSFGFDGKPVLQ